MRVWGSQVLVWAFGNFGVQACRFQGYFMVSILIQCLITV